MDVNTQPGITRVKNVNEALSVLLTYLANDPAQGVASEAYNTALGMWVETLDS